MPCKSLSSSASSKQDYLIDDQELEKVEQMSHLTANVVAARLKTQHAEWRGSDYVEYRIKVTQAGSSWEVGRRFSQFRALHRELARDGNLWLPKPPARTTGFFDHTARWVRIQRQFELQVYMYELLKRSPEVCRRETFQEFFRDDAGSPGSKPELV